MGEVILETIGLSKRFCRNPKFAMRYACADFLRELRGIPPRDNLRPGEFWALRDINICMEKGDVLGVVGHNGAGKSTLINLVAGLIRPTTGSIRLYTSKVAVMDHNGGLSGVETGRENIAIQMALHGCPAEQIPAESEAAIAFADIGDFIDAPVGTYSLGMRLRLAFSIYTRLNPDLFIVDEAIGGGDLRFRQRFQNWLRGYIDSGGSILFCSHELFLVQTLCKNSILMDRGTLKMYGESPTVLNFYQEMMLAASAAADAKIKQSTAKPSMERTEVETASPTTDDANKLVDPATVSKPQPTGVGTRRQASVDGMPVVESLSIKPQHGDILLPGCAVVIEVVCTAYHASEKIIWGLEIGRGPVTPVATMIGGYGDHHYSLVEGRNVFRAYIEQFPFAPGIYELRTGIYDLESGAILVRYGMHDEPVSFQVINPADKMFNMIVYRNSIMHIPTEWSTEVGGDFDEALENL